MKQILIATTNKHKVSEIRDIFFIHGIEFFTLNDFPQIEPAEEYGKTFGENARIKATYYFQQTGLPVIADDSGLVVPALNGEPGIHSARYAGPQSDYGRNNQLLLSRMADLSGSKRQAYFVCVAIYYDGQIVLSSEGRAEGQIVNKLRGERGFGYDPLFYYAPAGKTFAELTSDEKNRISHRSKAFKNLADQLLKKLDIKS
jgi:XTP/dITP diphosphohydrolase